MTRPLRGKYRNERGAILIHVTVVMIGLLAFLAFVVDYGVMWMSRRQAQNSADAGALAGAIALAFDDPLDTSVNGQGSKNATAFALQNKVFGEAPSVVPPGDVRIEKGLAGCDPDETCVRVDAYRTVARGNPLPTFFARLFGRTSQDIQATATARILSGTASDCLRPWAVADKWEEHVKGTCNNPNQQPPSCSGISWSANSVWDTNQTYDRWIKSGGGPWILNTAITDAGQTYDVYRAPGTDGPNDPGTGFGLYNPDGSLKDYGQLLTLKLGGGSDDTVSPGWFLSLDMSALCTNADCPNNTGASMYGYAIGQCVGGTAGFGDTIPVENGDMTGQTRANVYGSPGGGSGPMALYERDPGAYWDTTTKTIQGSCAPGICADGKYYGESPRIVPVPLFDLDVYLQAGYTGANGQVQITNIFGFFVLGTAQAESLGLWDGTGTIGDQVFGVMVSAPGLKATTTSTSSFLKTIVLVR